MASSSGGIVVDFPVKLWVSADHFKLDNLRLLQKKLQSRIYSLQQYLQEERQFAFFKVKEVWLKEEEPAVYFICEVSSVTDIDEFRKARRQGKLSKALQNFVLKNHLYKGLTPEDGLKVYPLLTEDTYKGVKDILISGETTESRSNGKDKKQDDHSVVVDVPTPGGDAQGKQAAEVHKGKPEATSMQDPYIQKTFLTYVPNPNNKYIGKVKMISKDCLHIDDERLEYRYGNIYACDVRIPATFLVHDISYKYEVHFAYNRFTYGLPLPAIAAATAVSQDQLVSESSVQRDIWPGFELESITAHLENIIFHAGESDAELKENVIQIENLLQSTKLTLKDCKALTRSIIVAMENNHPQQALLCTFVVGKLLHANNQLGTYMQIDQSKASQILAQLERYRLKYLPSLCQQYVPQACWKLSEICTGSSFSLLPCMALCYPFLDEGQLNIWADTSEHRFMVPESEGDKSALGYLSKCAISKLTAEGQSETQNQVKTFVKELVIYPPVSVSLQIEKTLLEESGHIEKTFLLDTVETLFLRICVETKNRKDSTLLLDFWDLVAQKDFLVTSYKENVEAQILDHLRNFQSGIESNIKRMYTSTRLFDSLNSQTKLVEVLSISKSAEMHSAFIDVMASEKFEICLNEVSISTIKNWFQTLTGTYLKGKRDKKVMELYVYAVRLLKIVPKSRHCYILEHLNGWMIGFLKKMEVSEVICSLWEVCEEAYMDMCVGHLKAVLQAGVKKLRLEEVLEELKDAKGKLRVHSRLAATAVCFTLELCCPLSESDSEVDCLVAMTKNQSVWLSVMSSYGKYKHILAESQTYKTAKSCIDKTMELLTEHRISLEFFSEAKLQDDKVRKLLFVSNLSDIEIKGLIDENEKLLQREKEKLKVIHSVVHVIHKKVTERLLLVHFIHEKVTERLSNSFDMFLKELDDLVRDFEKMKRNEYLSRFDELFPDENVYELCELSLAVVQSKVYWNTFKRHADSLSMDNTDTSEDDEVLRDLSALFCEVSIAETPDYARCTRFVYKCLEMGNRVYTDQWKNIQDSPEVDMKSIFSMFKNCFLTIKEEIDFAKTHLRHAVSGDCRTCLLRLGKLETMKTKMNAMESAVKAFGLDVEEDEEFYKVVSSFRQLLNEESKRLTFREISKQLDVVFCIAEILDEPTIDILRSVGGASSLIDFLRTIIEEDIRNLIDAVEDISEQHVSESTVSALIEVKRFFKPLLDTSEQTCTSLLQCFERHTKNMDKLAHSLPSKIEDCMNNLHNLISLYNNVANRGEQTKQIIQNIVKQGKFNFHLAVDQKMCDFTATYTQVETEQNVTHSKAALCDFRSRALLLMNSERYANAKSMVELDTFVNAINICLDVSEHVFELHASGHLKYPDYKKTVAFDHLDSHQKSLVDELQSWMEILKTIRETFYLMNFIQGSHIHALDKYLRRNGEPEIVDILKFLHPELTAKMLKEHYSIHEKEMEVSGEYDALTVLGMALTSSFKRMTPFKRTVVTTDDKEKRMTDIVQTGRLLVARIDEGNILVVKTLLALYLRTAQRIPEPSEVLLCSRETTWNEVELILGRCLGAYSFYGSETLYCIANVEVLPSEIHFKLVEVLKNLDRDLNFQLAIVCQGSANHPLIDEFYDNVAAIRPLSDETVRKIFLEVCPTVFTYTSETAGLGKTSAIMAKAKQNKKTMKTFHVSGSMLKRKLIERLRSLKLDETDLLHVDIGYVDNLLELDMFIFELVILKFAVADGIAIDLSTLHVCVEIANTINNTLRNSLQTAISFQRKHLKWNNFRDFIVTKEINSPVQIVCHYLYSLEKGVVDKTDLMFSGDTCSKPLPTKVCRYLLHKYFNISDTFIVTNTCISVLADQLKKLSNSAFFKTSRIRDMTNERTGSTVKSSMVRALVEVSKELACRSVDAYRSTQQQTLDSKAVRTEGTRLNLAASATKHVEHMIRWEDSNHLIYVFHNQNIQTISPMYRHLSLVPKHITDLFDSQMKRPMCDFKSLEQKGLQAVLQKVARTNPASLPPDKLVALAEEYALTPDNLLKMVLIILRIKARVPVLVMGETGCGKTSLIRYLAEICEVDFDVISIHAGVEERTIISRVMENNGKASENLEMERWVFLDEINTSEYIGLISDMLCHHRCLGNLLSPNLVLLSACNPYKLRSSKSILTSGLKGKVRTDELSRLVYRVLPLPEMLVDYVWDFGSLSENDEKVYIDRMIGSLFQEFKSIHNLFVDLLSMSQKFARAVEETTSSVSLRDIQRCKILTEWFYETLLKKRPKVKMSYRATETDSKRTAIMLSLSHCYLSRFSDKDIRKSYLQHMASVCLLHNLFLYSADYIQTMINEEQRYILSRMELPPGTAQNTALCENVFVVLICILNRIPIFLVGKPGCSKSLSLQVIKSNLRGKDSKDPFFRTLPQLYCVSFQGSESSTSDGILKVFEKAEKYQDVNHTDDVLSVVILDEIGLAEISRFNPLKVLHNLLEPDGNVRPNVAVVGVSNWSLDASKMNRAIHLSRPEMDEEELYETALSISNSFQREEKRDILKHMEEESYSFRTQDIAEHLKNLASSYTDYILALRFENFHGLRDYYSLIKYIARIVSSAKQKPSEKEVLEIISCGIERNFGGLPAERETLLKKFHIPPTTMTPVLDLVTENVRDPLARHLMVITTGESVLGIVEQSLKLAKRNKREVLFGSQFEEDLTDDYNYRMLSRIILCMEQGIVLILKDLESIYGSLYDMLNKNYTEIGKKKHCRVALGAYSNPICHVHEDFRCIVLVDESQVDFTDPPFLNRFEKQKVRFSDIIKESHEVIIAEAEQWIEDFSSVEGKSFTREDCFPLYSKDMVASYVIQKDESSETCFLENIQKDLLWIMKPESILRSKMSSGESIRDEAENYIEEYLQLPLHSGLSGLLKHQLDGTQANLMTIVLTNSNIHSRSLHGVSEGTKQIEKLSAFKSEKQLSTRMQQFWLESDTELLFVQCSAIDDEKHIMLAKSVIERNRSEFVTDNPVKFKKVYLIVHLDKNKGRSSVVSQINFLRGWQLVVLDSIESPVTPFPALCSLSLIEAVMAKRPLDQHIKDQLFWAFTRIKYCKSGRDVDSITVVLNKMRHSDSFIHIVEEQVCSWIDSYCPDGQNTEWQEMVACDPHALDTSQTLVDALEKHILQVINTPLSKYVYQMEHMGITDAYFVEDEFSTERKSVWERLLKSETVFSITDVHDESGPETFDCQTEDFTLKMPFSLYIFKIVETTREEFLNSVMMLKSLFELDEDDALPKEVIEKLLIKQEMVILQKLPDLKMFVYGNWINDYIDDFSNLMSFDKCSGLDRIKKINIMKWLLKQKVDLSMEESSNFLTVLHTSYWSNSHLFQAQLQLFELCQSSDLSEENVSWVENIIQELDAVEDTGEEEEMLSSMVSPNDENKQTEEELRVLYSRQELVQDDDLLLGSDTIMHYESATESEGSDDAMSDEANIDTVPADEVVSSDFNAENDKDSDTETFEKDIEAKKLETSDVKEGCESEQDDTECLEESAEEIVDDDNSSECSSSSPEWSAVSDVSDESGVTGKGLTTEYKLVDTLCRKMLPTSQVVEYHGGLASWQCKVYCLLRLAANVSDRPSSLHGLRFCNDIAVELFSSVETSDSNLETIADYLKDGKPLESKAVFLSLMKLIAECRDENDRKCQRLFSSYILKCYILNPETKAMELFLLALEKDKIPDRKLSYLKLPLSTVLKLESGEFYISILQSPGALEVGDDNNFLISLDKCLSTGEERMSELSKLVTDILVEIYTETFMDDEEEVDFSSVFLDSDRCLRNDFGLLYLAGVAYCKAFFNFFLFKDNELSGEYLDIVLPVLQSADEDDRSGCLLTYFMKLFAMKSSVAKHWHRCDLLKMPFLNKKGWFDGDGLDVGQCSEMCPMKVHCSDEVDKIMTILTKTTENPGLGEDLKKLLLDSRGSYTGIVGIYGAVLQHFYLPRVFMDMDDSRGMQATEIRTISRECFSVRESMKLLTCLLGKCDFEVPDLMIHTGSSSTDFFISSVLISLYIFLHAHLEHKKPDQMSILTTCLLNPISVKESFLPGIPDCDKVQETRSATGHLVGTKKFCTCSCGVRLCCTQEDIVCINCGRSNSGNEEYTIPSSEEDVSETGFVLSCEEDDGCVRKLSPVVSNMLSILTKGCFLGSVALGHSTTKDLEDIGVPENATEVLWTDIVKHWNHLLDIMIMEEFHLSLLFQAVFTKVRHFICVEKSQMMTSNERCEWETSFSLLVESVVTDRFLFVNQMFAAQCRNKRQQNNEIEGHVRELTYDFEESRDHQRPNMTDLLRLHGEPSMINFMEEFHGEREMFPFLQLVLELHETLSLPKHILTVVQWHVIVTSNVSYVLKKQDCMNMTVAEFIHLTSDEEQRKTRRRRFEAFKEAWNAIKEALKGTDFSTDVERFHGQTKLSECLILDDKSLVYKVLCHLVKIQNEFLDKSLAVSHSCKSVQFLCRKPDKSMVTCVDLAKVIAKQLVDFSTTWEECLANYSQSKLAYGHGRHIEYDFSSIEKSLAVHLLNGKAYINIEDALPRVIFTDEMYRNFASLVNELRACIKQSPIPKSTLQAINANHETNPKMATDLLMHLGIIMSLLKKAKGEPDTALIDYVEDWKTILSRALPDDLLPSPTNSIKLGHVVALHEVLEELSAPSIVDALGDEYQTKLDADMESHFDGLVVRQFKLTETVLGTIRRFVFRCLSVRDADPTCQMVDYLLDESFWPVGMVADGKIVFGSDEFAVTAIIPRGLMVSQVVSVVTFLEEEIEKKHSRDLNMSQMAASFRVIEATPTQSKSKKSQKKVRKMMNF